MCPFRIMFQAKLNNGIIVYCVIFFTLYLLTGCCPFHFSYPIQEPGQALSQTAPGDGYLKGAVLVITCALAPWRPPRRAALIAPEPALTRASTTFHNTGDETSDDHKLLHYALEAYDYKKTYF